MALDIELPSISEQLNSSPITETDADLSNHSDFNFVLIYLPETPRVAVERSHLIQTVNTAENDSILASISPKTDVTTLFHITDNTSQAYTASAGDGIHALVNILLCEDWFVLKYDDAFLSDPVNDFFSEMTILQDGSAEEGELFSQAFARNKLKTRIYSIKQSDAELFGETKNS